VKRFDSEKFPMNFLLIGNPYSSVSGKRFPLFRPTNGTLFSNRREKFSPFLAPLPKKCARKRICCIEIPFFIQSLEFGNCIA
jgi:hypothetical protein